MDLRCRAFAPFSRFTPRSAEDGQRGYSRGGEGHRKHGDGFAYGVEDLQHGALFAAVGMFDKIDNGRNVSSAQILICNVSGQRYLIK